MRLIDRKPKETLAEFLTEYSKTQNININQALNDIDNLRKYYGGDSTKRDELVHLIRLENQWYDALKRNEVDYSVYDDDYYFADLWACWSIYSRGYLRSIVKSNSYNGQISIMDILPSINSVLDLGCGIGYTTAGWKEIFPNADVYGSNIEGTKQWAFCQYMSQKYSFHLISETNKLSQRMDLVFASEYFEHIERPFQHLDNIIKNANPKVFIIANAFNTRSVGHFINYKHQNGTVHQSNAQKIFDSILKSYNYTKIKTKLWNNRPSIWIKNVKQ